MSRIPSKSIRYGRNRDNAAYDDDKYVKCWHCGFICQLQRDSRARIGSNAQDGITHVDAGNAWGDAVWGNKRWGESVANEPVVNAGCPQCGCLHYERKN